jgi:AraC-like DNA-binding protein
MDDLWSKLMASEEVRRQQVAFSCATGLPVTLLPPASPESGASPGPGKRKPTLPAILCVEGCMGPRSGELCQSSYLSVERRAVEFGKALQYRCPAGLLKILMPVRIGGRHVGSLLVGPFCLDSLNPQQLTRMSVRLRQWGLDSQMEGLLASWRGSPEVTPEKLRALETLLEMFASYLIGCADKLLAQPPGKISSRSALLDKVQAYLHEGTGRSLTVRELASRLNVSACHFCKTFKKQTGFTFTEYRVRSRIEVAKRLLMNPHLRISEAAFEAGFDSIPYFNRAFRRHVGVSPTQFRNLEASGHAGKSKTRK